MDASEFAEIDWSDELGAWDWALNHAYHIPNCWPTPLEPLDVDGAYWIGRTETDESGGRDSPGETYKSSLDRPLEL